MNITERLANLTIPQVLIIVAVLAAIRFLLPRLNKDPWAKSVAEIAESLAVAMALVFLLIRPFLVQAFYIPSASMHPTLLEKDHILVNKLVYRLREPKAGDVIVFKAPPNATPELVTEANSEADAQGLKPGPEREQFIVDYERPREKDFIKRVIAVPGDIVRITPAKIMVGEVEYTRNDVLERLADYQQRDVEGRHTLRLFKDRVLVDGTRYVTKAEIAAAFGDPKAKVVISPGTVYVNGKARVEPFIAEDPDAPYPAATNGPNFMGGPSWEATPDTRYIVNYKGENAMKVPPGRLLVMGDNRNDSRDARFWGLLDRQRVLGKAMFVFWPLNRIKIIH